MKKLFFTLLIAVFALTACKPSAERYISDLKNFVEKVAEEGSDYTAEQWEKVSQEFDELVQRAEELEGLTDEQKKEIKEYLAGNLCRCTGYQAMVDAVKSLINM